MTKSLHKSEHYKLSCIKEDKKLNLALSALDAAHAQGQALDIARSLEAERFSLELRQDKKYKIIKPVRKTGLQQIQSQRL